MLSLCEQHLQQLIRRISLRLFENTGLRSTYGKRTSDGRQERQEKREKQLYQEQERSKSSTKTKGKSGGNVNAGGWQLW